MLSIFNPSTPGVTSTCSRATSVPVTITFWLSACRPAATTLTVGTTS
ncbi:MAG: hypothetical protein H6Q99_4270 [Proteobacteria bacterium]|nr:hypothetical protein [Pseudomonadota bacterium]